jgi:Ni,Fe-hydrogenase I cytochrome b subunit
MAKPGLLTSAGGLLVSAVGTLLLFLHATSKYHAAIQDMGTIAVAYLGVVLLGVSMSVTGVALLSAEEGD